MSTVFIALTISFDLSSICGLIASLLIGLSLGLIGGGGSILTVPILVYLFHIEPVLATAYSLFIVGATSIIGTIPKYKAGQVKINTALLFGIPSILGVFLTRTFILPQIPYILFSGNSFSITKNIFLMVLFASLMIAASYSMIKSSKTIEASPSSATQLNYPLIITLGAMEGFLTGLVGAGGGFLIIPALVLFTQLPMKEAIGTSLLIIAAKSLIGFLGDLSHSEMDWSLLGLLSGIAILGILIGNRLSRKIDGQKLKKGFAWFVLTVGVYILIREGVRSVH
ncbi:MAG: sulfite exporter TauE/SafE family protein [Chitinophagaceae bacterium]|nr:sulfite exporter TauE/SafE family protein [Chitinophagaceae bacterium]